MWRLNTRYEGTDILLKPYQAVVITYLLNNPDKEIKSLDAFDETKRVMGDNAPSRASVINFLQLLLKHGYLTEKLKSGKGGYHSLYSPLEPNAFISKMKNEINSKTREAINALKSQIENL